MDEDVMRKHMSKVVSMARYKSRVVRDLKFTIDIDYVMKLGRRQKWRCALTGWPMQFTRGGDWHGCNPRGVTLDRKDNSKGYIPGNVQLACAQPNMIRSDLTLEQFRKLCRAVADKNRRS